MQGEIQYFWQRLKVGICPDRRHEKVLQIYIDENEIGDIK